MIPSSAAPFVTASAEADDELRARLDQLVQASVELAEDRLLAVVLGGSLARGEGVLLQHGQAHSLLSDIDVYLVVERCHLELDAQLRERLNNVFVGDRFLAAPLDLGIVEPDYFEQRARRVDAHQLQHGHRVLWQRGSNPLELPQGGAREIDRDDALRLLHNRFAEQLWVGWRGIEESPDPFALYHRWKLVLDAPLAWLAGTGGYHPQRSEQLSRVESRLAAVSGAAGARLAGGLGLYRQVQAAVASGVVSFDLLRQLPSSSDVDTPSWAANPKVYALVARQPLVAWAWPFYRALLGPDRAAPAAGIEAALLAGEPTEGDWERGRRWLRRSAYPARLRRARRWAQLAPRRVTPWWNHGRGGSGPDRVYLAIALRFAGLDNWRVPLAGLVVETHGMSAVPRDPARIDTWLAQLWSDWMMGGSR